MQRQHCLEQLHVPLTAVNAGEGHMTLCLSAYTLSALLCVRSAFQDVVFNNTGWQGKAFAQPAL